MKLKATGLLLAIAVLLAMAAPAMADPAALDVGVFVGTADVGKTGTCDPDGSMNDIAGQGIGLLPVVDAKNAAYRISSPGVQSLVHGAGNLNLCGYLTAPLHEAAGEDTPDTKVLGATCAATKGWGGQGRGTFPTSTNKNVAHTVDLTDLGWKATVGGTFLVTADASSNGSDDTLIAVVQALSETAVVGCIDKTAANATTGKSGGPDTFTVVAAYTIVPGDHNPEKAPKK